MLRMVSLPRFTGEDENRRRSGNSRPDERSEIRGDGGLSARPAFRFAPYGLRLLSRGLYPLPRRKHCAVRTKLACDAALPPPLAGEGWGGGRRAEWIAGSRAIRSRLLPTSAPKMPIPGLPGIGGAARQWRGTVRARQVCPPSVRPALALLRRTRYINRTAPVVRPSISRRPKASDNEGLGMSTRTDSAILRRAFPALTAAALIPGSLLLLISP
jgi:hypothetical protein